MRLDSLRQRLARHVAVRLLVATGLMGAAIAVQMRAPGSLPIEAFFFLIGLTYVASLLFIASLRWVPRIPWLAELHFGLDALLVSACVYLTGGVGSLFTTLYALPILAASTVRFRRGGVQVAALSATLFVALTIGQYFQQAGLVNLPFEEYATDELPALVVALYIVGLNVFGFFAVAFLGGSLADRAQRADVRFERATEEIADIQAFNQYVLDNLLSGLATADSQNRLLTFNLSAMAITGRTGALPIGEYSSQVLQLPTEFTTRLDDDLQRARSKRMDYRFVRPDGQAIDVGLSVSGLPLPDGGRGFVYTFQDVTDVRRAEQTQRLQQRLAAVGEMAAGIAHEIRNPLASMVGSMQLLQQELTLSPDQAQLIAIVLRESDRLNQTIKSFLAYAHPPRAQWQRFDLRTVVEETATLLRHSAEVLPAHAVELALPPGDVMLEADEHQLRQILWNLATNGLRAMPDGGHLRLAAGTETRATTEQVILEVTDEGVGIPADEVDKIFQPFRGSFSKGSGLGLALVHRIVTDYNGHIEVRSTVGVGTTIRVVLPARKGQVARAS